MAQIDYTKELFNVLQVLHTEDVENGEKLRLILYDWSIQLTYCVGALQLITYLDAFSSIDSRQRDVLEEAEGKLNGLIMCMRNTLKNDSLE